MKTDSVTIGAIYDDWKQDSGFEKDINPELIKKWANDVATKVITDEQLVHKIALLNVRTYRAELPEDYKFVMQAAYNPKFDKKVTREQLVEWTTKASNGYDVTIRKECEETGTDCNAPIVEVDVNRIWASANPQTQTAYMKHFFDYGGNAIRDGRGCLFSPVFKLMRPSQSTMFNLPMHLDGCSTGTDNDVEYKIEPPNIITNFKDGQVLLSYMGAKMDDEGWYYVPNIPEVFDAANFAIEEKLARRAYVRQPNQGNRALWTDMLTQKERILARAKSKLQIPDADEWMVLMRNHFNKLKPYWQYESNLNRMEADQYERPNESYNW